MSFTAWKRALSEGSSIDIDNHIRPQHSRRATVLKAQTNAVCTTHDDAPRGSWIYWPKASDVDVVDDRTIRLLENGEAWVTLTIAS